VALHRRAATVVVVVASVEVDHRLENPFKEIVT
jgi:hypothetical protein